MLRQPPRQRWHGEGGLHITLYEGSTLVFAVPAYITAPAKRAYLVSHLPAWIQKTSVTWLAVNPTPVEPAYTPPGRVARVRFSGKDRLVIDPFAETKERIVGYWLWKAASLHKRSTVKRRPNPHDEQCEIEIRPVFEADDLGEALTPELRAQEERVMAGAKRNSTACGAGLSRPTAAPPPTRSRTGATFASPNLNLAPMRGAPAFLKWVPLTYPSVARAAALRPRRAAHAAV